MNTSHLTYDLLKKYSKYNIGFIKTFQTILIFEKYFNYFSPNTYMVCFLRDSITFYTQRYIGNDCINTQTVFDLKSNILKISEYEKQYLKEIKK